MNALQDASHRVHFVTLPIILRKQNCHRAFKWRSSSHRPGQLWSQPHPYEQKTIALGVAVQVSWPTTPFAGPPRNGHCALDLGTLCWMCRNHSDLSCTLISSPRRYQKCRGGSCSTWAKKCAKLFTKMCTVRLIWIKMFQSHASIKLTGSKEARAAQMSPICAL